MRALVVSVTINSGDWCYEVVLRNVLRKGYVEVLRNGSFPRVSVFREFESVSLPGASPLRTRFRPARVTGWTRVVSDQIPRRIEVGEDLGRCDDIGAFDQDRRQWSSYKWGAWWGWLEPPVLWGSVVFTPRRGVSAASPFRSHDASSGGIPSRSAAVPSTRSAASAMVRSRSSAPAGAIS